MQQNFGTLRLAIVSLIPLLRKQPCLECPGHNRKRQAKIDSEKMGPDDMRTDAANGKPGCV